MPNEQSTGFRACKKSAEAILFTLFLASVVAAQNRGGDAQPNPRPPELTGTLSYDIASQSGAVQNIVITVGDGGSGLYKAVLMGDPALPTHTIYRPHDLKPFGASLKMPIVAWANGGCRNSSGEFRNFLTEVASHGFLVLAIGPAGNAVASGSEAAGNGSKSSQLLDAVDWATRENGRSGSEYFGKIDTAKIAVMGQSCGGLQAMEVSTDPRVSTTVLWNSGLFAAVNARGRGTQPESGQGAAPASPGAAQVGAGRAGGGIGGMPQVGKETLAKLHAPIAYFIGGKSDIAFGNAADDFAKIDGVSVFMANRDVGHYPATYREPRGGAFAIVGVAWLKWQLKGDQTAAKMFTGDNCGLCSDPKWTVEKKKIQ